MYKLYQIKIKLSKFRTVDYTGKLVKAILIQANDKLEELFESEKYPSPKPIRITPIFKDKQPIYSKVIVKKFGEDRKPNFPPREIEINGEYTFFIGVKDEVNIELQKALTNLIKGIDFDYGSYRVSAKMIEFEEKEPTIQENFHILKIKFNSPCVFRDPFTRIASMERKSTEKRFLPFPPFIFSVNVYEISREIYKRNIIRLAYSLVESHNNLNTVMKVWYYYDGDWLPGIIGYAKFYLKKDLPTFVIKNLVEIFKHAQIMGVGTGRAAGFGFAEIETV
ncbi:MULTISPECIES: CRISPR system precrRNA processing endoribonuclease RAMP protein Cas6 [Metallosphaera]|uniref:CRISPR system precrRNA processing endoribonuclease RAMP protein Cas6 n=1 Tax=Metallosphaera TaxID=41980 RepID=UPI001F0695C9|nr:CRISPR system precrRNA processing endoribonuclease RAMP protein Cas6 [Metallosphaera sedula]MCH1770472.1 CRISPR system precrRNA processing endoribonuclease RAMP protein Cas6 [Metallosphaera sedula]